MAKTLSYLLEALPKGQIIRITGAAPGSVAVTSPVVESDADVKPGGIFVARVGLSSDGHQFIHRVIQRGASAVIGERDVEELGDVGATYVQVRNAQECIGFLAAAYHGFPSRKLIIVGVTGTDGKTTTSTLIHSILNAGGRRAGLISTIAADLGGQTLDTGLHVTTPGAPQVQALLAQMVANGLTHCVLEMTSHGLAQGRLNGVDVDVAVLTNLTHEHLDFHGTFDAYRAAKGRMFEMLSRSARKDDQRKLAVINADDASAGYFAQFEADRTMRYGLLDGKVNFRAAQIRYEPEATYFDISGLWALPETFQISLVGEFNVLNSLAAIAATYDLVDGDAAAVRRGLAAVRGVSGRMERVDEGQPFTALVDFAHTPNALRRALEAARTMLMRGGRVITVFGSAGLRDREKRVLMAEVAGLMADYTILTAEDPRTESLDEILQVMAETLVKSGGIEGRTFERIADRGEALYRACRLARPGDIVIACGKGHEQSMCFGTTEYAWDDREALRAALRGTPLRTLPTAAV